VSIQLFPPPHVMAALSLKRQAQQPRAPNGYCQQLATRPRMCMPAPHYVTQHHRQQARSLRRRCHDSSSGFDGASVLELEVRLPCLALPCSHMSSRQPCMGLHQVTQSKLPIQHSDSLALTLASRTRPRTST
jgi:hypothetical protein